MTGWEAIRAIQEGKCAKCGSWIYRIGRQCPWQLLHWNNESWLNTPSIPAAWLLADGWEIVPDPSKREEMEEERGIPSELEAMAESADFWQRRCNELHQELERLKDGPLMPLIYWPPQDMERQQHERRVWEMLNSVVRACYSVDRITAVEVNHWAEEVVAEYERRMKEQKESENGHD